jgi:hypothetical protein
VQIFASIPRRLAVGLLATGAAVLASLVIAAFTLPTQCAPESGTCLPAAAASVDIVQPQIMPDVAPAAEKSFAPTAASMVPAAAIVPAPAVQPEPSALPTAHGLIAATFGRLPPVSNTFKPDSTMAKRPATPAAGPASPSTRLVTTTIIRPNVTATLADANANPGDVTAKPIEVASTDPVQIPQATPPAPKTIVEVAPVSAPAPAPTQKMQLGARDPAPPAQPAQPAPKSGAMVVTGKGVTVRSGPAKSNAALFALAGGQKVTVTDNQKGWLQIVDGQGRTGWAYSSFLAKS